MQNFVSVFFRTIAVLVFLYLNWRKLGENYEEKKLVFVNWMSLLFFMLGARLAYGLLNWGIWNRSIFDWFLFFSKPGMFDVGGYLGFLLVTGIMLRTYGWKYWAFLEDSVSPFLWFLLLWRVGERSINLSWYLREILLFLTLSFCWILAKKYRSFWWYKSGKKGFVFWMANLIFACGFFVMAVVFGYEQSQKYLILIMALISGLGLFILGEVFKRV